MVDTGYSNRAALKLPAALFVFVFFTYGYFYQSGQDNENARLAQVAGIVESGTLDIPPHRRGHSADVVRYDGKVYPNKAPGTSLIAVPSFWLFSQLMRPLGLSESFGENLVAHLTVWLTVGLASSLLAVLLYSILEQVLRSFSLALFVALSYALGTIAFPFSTMFFSHQLAAALLFCSFGLVFLFKERCRGDPGEDPSPFRSPSLLVVAGVLCGYALTTEYPTALAVGPITLYALLVLPWKRRFPLFLAGLAIGGGILAAYNLLAFGKVYMIPYAAYADTGKFAEHEIGYMGVTIPSWSVLKEITFLPRRGLFFVNPWLALILPGLLVPLFSKKYRKENLLCAFIVVAFFAFNAGYGKSVIFWGGGASVGPRHIIPMLPFAVFLIAQLLRNRFLRYPFYAASLLSIAIMFMATATEPRVSYAYRNPLVQLFWDGYVTGRLAIDFHGPFSSILVTEDSVAFNLGKLLGLPARFQFLPLFLFWFLMFLGILPLVRRRAALPASIVGVSLLALFLLPFLYGNLAAEAGTHGHGLRSMYVQGILWEDPPRTYEPPQVPGERIFETGVDEFVMFPWHDMQPPIKGPFSAEWTGSIYIPEDGPYKFATDSDDGSVVYIDDRLLLDNWGKRAGRRRRHADIRLEKGFHRIAVRYYNLGHRGGMYLLWARPGKHIQSVAKQYVFPDNPAR